MAYKPVLILAGGSGYLGRLLSNHLKNHYQIIVLGRKEQAESGISCLKYPENHKDLVPVLEGAFGLINLAGKSVDCRYTEKNKKEILDSRVNTTRYLGEAVAACEKAPQVWLNLSSATIYPDSQEMQRETSLTPGGNFSEDVCLAWEHAFFDTQTPNTRKVALRCGLVFGKEGGAFPVFRHLARFYLAGKQGSGNQFMSILHEMDFVRSVQHLLKHRSMGIYNLCIPQPVRNKAFMALLAQQFNQWPQLQQPEWLVKLGAVFIRTEAELVLKSRCVVPERLLNEGFQFEYDSTESILQALKKDYFQSEEKSSRSPKTGNLDRASRTSDKLSSASTIPAS